MPYEGSDDTSLPANVKRRSVAQRRQWVTVFNSAHDQCISRGGSEQTCEARAFQAANGVALAELTTVEIEGIEVLSVGTFNGNKFTTARLREMVVAHKATVNILDPPVKLGHDDEQRLLQEDGFPAAGWIRNLRLEGDKLLATFTKVPKKVADLIESGAYRKRSSEIRFDMELGGVTYPTVLVGVALLGEDIPAVESLEDIVELYTRIDLELEEGTTPIVANLAVWTRAFINDLPDSAFALITGKAKDKDGRTVPRVLRHLPHHGSGGELDLPHLRNSLSRLPQTKVSTTLKRQALAHLRRHAKTKGVGEQANESMQIAEEALAVEQELRELLGLDAEADIIEAVTALRDGGSEIATELGLQEGQDAVSIIKELREKATAKSNGSKPKGEGDNAGLVALKEELTETQKQVLTLQGDAARTVAESRVDGDIKEGRLLPRQREVALKLALRDESDYSAFIDTQPKGQLDLSERGSTASAEAVAGLEPTEDEIQMAKELGTWNEGFRIRLIREKAAERGVTLPVDFDKDDKKDD